MASAFISLYIGTMAGLHSRRHAWVWWVQTKDRVSHGVLDVEWGLPR